MAKSKQPRCVIWDGVSVREVSRQEGEELVKADKAMMADGDRWPGPLKARADFTGYQTREMRPADPAPPAPANKKAPAKKAATKKTPPKSKK